MRPPRPTWTPAEVRRLARENVTTTVELAGEVLGMGRSAAYDAVHRGTFPVPVLRITTRRWVVPTAALLRLLGLDEPTEELAEEAGRG